MEVWKKHMQRCWHKNKLGCHMLMVYICNGAVNAAGIYTIDTDTGVADNGMEHLTCFCFHATQVQVNAQAPYQTSLQRRKGRNRSDGL